MVKKKNLIAGVSTGVVGVILFATTIGLVTRIRYTGENPRAELENLVSRVKNVAFKSDVFDNSATYKEIKAKLFDENGKLLPGIDLNKFISFYTTYNSKIRKFDVSFTPNKPFFEFVNLIPNDEDQSFELQFRAKHQLDNNYTAYSTILSKKITFAQRSQFALADFNANLEKITESFKQNIQNLRKKDLTRNFASQNISIVSQKIPSLTRVEDFASDINKSGTQEEAVEKISQYFPDFQKIIYELNDDRNNNLPFRKGKIFNFSLERHTGTNDFIALNANSEPSFLVKAELTNEAKFELKGLNIQQVQMLEKIDLVPTTEKTNADSTNNQQQETEKTPGQTEQTEADKENKDSKTEAKKASYFANLDDILAKISIRKLTFTDFKVAPGDTTEASPPAAAAAQAASQTSVQEETRVLNQVASTTQFQEQVQENGSGSSQSSGAESSAPSGGSGSSGAPQSSGTTENETNQEPPAAPKKEEDAETKIEELAKKLTVNTKTANEFLDTLNEKLYSSKRGRAKGVAEKINEELLIKPLSLDFGELKQYFPETNPQGVEFSLDITNAKVNKTKLEIPVDINLYSSFFGDSSNKFLKSRKDKLEIPWFKAESGSTGANQEQKQELDKKRKQFFFVNSLPENSPEIQAVPVNVDAQATVAEEKKREEKIVSTTGYISKAELEKLIEGNSHQEIKDISSNPFQYGYDFRPTDSMLNAWVGKQKFPSLADLAEFKENKEIESEYKVKSLNSDKFFATESDVAAFYAYLANLEPAEVLQYLFEIAKSANLISESQKLDLNNVSEGDVFNAASSIEFNKSSDVYGLDFNSHIKSFEKRGWFSNLFLPKKIAENFTKKETDSEIFEKINTIKEAKIPEESGAGTSSTGGGSDTNNDLYKDIRDAAKKIEDSLKKVENNGILKIETPSGSGQQQQQQQQPEPPISESVKKFYTSNAHKLSNLRDLMLAFYVKAKELNNFRPWAKISEDLDYQLVFEKQTGSNHSNGLDVPSDAENYKLTYYYKITDKKSKKEEYSSPKTTLTLLVQKEGSFKNTEEKNKLNEAILRIPPSYSVIQLEKEEFDKLNIGQGESNSSSNKKAFEERKEFKEIQEIVKKFDPKLKVSVKSEEKDSFNPEKVKIILLQVSSGGEVTSDSEKKSLLKFQIRVEQIEKKATKKRYDAQKALSEEIKKRLELLIPQRPGLPGPSGPFPQSALPLATMLTSIKKASNS